MHISRLMLNAICPKRAALYHSILLEFSKPTCTSVDVDSSKTGSISPAGGIF
jgi:hypothetical protein